MKDLGREFERRKPWVTKFIIEEQGYSGKYDAANVIRLKWVSDYFPNAGQILELGSLEGGHSFALASCAHVKRVVAVDGRKANLQRAQFMQSVLRDWSKITSDFLFACTSSSLNLPVYFQDLI